MRRPERSYRSIPDKKPERSYHSIPDEKTREKLDVKEEEDVS